MSAEKKDYSGPRILYSTPEVYLPEFRIGSGGLGVLAACHFMAADNARMHFTGQAPFYKYGYFEQQFYPDGWQKEAYPKLDPNKNGMKLLRKDGRNLTVPVEIQGQTVHVGAYQYNFSEGNPAKYNLLTTDIEENGEEYYGSQENSTRMITGHLYGAAYDGDNQTRLKQEIVMGYGGYKLSKALGEEYDIYHLNDAHPSFLVMALLEDTLNGQSVTKETVRAAVEKLRPHIAYTTHTIVEAARDRFDEDQLRSHLPERSFEVVSKVAELASEQYGGDPRVLDMTNAARYMAGAKNTVSLRHYEQALWEWHEKIPNVTNGVFVPRWLSRNTVDFIGPDYETLMENHTNPLFIQCRLAHRSTEDFRKYRYRQRAELVDYVNGRVGSNLLRPDVLTLAYARRAATYKRVDSVFDDPDALADIISTPGREIQIVVAGKAHPRDAAGKEMLRRIINTSRDHLGLQKRVVFLEDYDRDVAMQMIKADGWPNTPREGQEACGTSGMKAADNGSMTISTDDGWVYELPNKHDMAYIIKDSEYRHELVGNIHDTLRQVQTDFYDADGRPVSGAWAHKLRSSMGYIIPTFSADRMLQDYLDKVYLPLYFSQQETQKIAA